MPIIGGGGGGGGGAGGLTTIVDTTLGAPAASFDVTGISQSFITLWAIVYARADDAATNTTVRLRFNNDSGANYYRERLLVNNGTAGGLENQAANAAEMGQVPAATGTANRFGIAQVWIPNYANAANQKMCNAIGGQLFDNTAGDAYMLAYTGAWLNTAAINRLTIFSGTGGNWVAGSRLTIYAL